MEIRNEVKAAEIRAEPVDYTVGTSRDRIQEEAVDKLFRYNNLLLKWGTATGKSRVAVLACDRLVREAEPGYPPYILIFVAETSHKENWKKEFIKFLGKERAESVLRYVIIECYASMKKYADTECTLLIADECHHLQSEKRQEILETIESEYVLALSATPGRAAYDALSWTFGRFEIDEVSIQDAIDSEYLPEPRIVCIPLELERFERTETINMKMSSRTAITVSDNWSNRWKYLRNKQKYARYEITFHCTQKEKYEYINEQFEYWKKQYFRNQGNERIKNLWLQWGSRRKRFLGELKTARTLELIKGLRESSRRFICFCSSIEQAHTLGGERAVHSQNKNSPAVIKAFNDRKIDEIFAVGMLVEGVTLTELNSCVIIQLDGNERQFIQKMGRGMRSKNPCIYIFYYKDTRDEEYLQKALEGINEEYIEYESDNRD